MTRLYKSLCALTAVVLFALLAPGAFAQSPTVSAPADISWELPTTATDGSPLTGAQALTGIKVWISTSPIADNTAAPPLVELGPTATTTSQSVTAQVGDTLYIRLKACNIFGCSAFTNPVTTKVEGAAPNVPTNVQVVIHITEPVQSP